jgi:hypothetical protein
VTAFKAQNCPYCGSLHERTVCHLVKAIEYHPNGSVKRVEFKSSADFRQYEIKAPFLGSFADSAA